MPDSCANPRCDRPAHSRFTLIKTIRGSTLIHRDYNLCARCAASPRIHSIVRQLLMKTPLKARA